MNWTVYAVSMEVLAVLSLYLIVWMLACIVDSLRALLLKREEK